ncbi:MAG: hypothetical protein N3A61_07065 [Ignavibacteria bacterium]|nr:hypothetical protein [Ignavibacteria bacterium]
MKERIKEHFSIYWFSYLLIPLSLYFIFSRGNYTILDLVDLFIHEGGHGIFRIFGQFIYMLGGTLMQIILPAFCAIMFIIWQKKIMAQASTFWLAQNFVNISVYAADAGKMKLKILGQIHDWQWILSRLDLVEYADEIGLTFYVVGIIVFLISLLIPRFLQ